MWHDVRMRRWWLLVPVVVLAACSDAPSGDEIEAAAQKVSAAPAPEGSSDRFEFDDQPSAVRIGDTTAWRLERCNDESCPVVVRNFTPLTFASIDEACAAVDAYVDAIGGSKGLASCPPTGMASSIAAAGDQGGVGDSVVVVVPGGEFGNTVMFALWYTATETTLGLGIGQQFCSDTATVQACTSD